MKTLILVTFLTSLMSNQVIAQSRIIGDVKDTKGKSLSFANVLLLSATDSTLVKGVVSEQDGQFVLETNKEGNHLLAISMVGFQKVYSPPFIIRKVDQINMPTFLLTEVAGQLNAVSVTAQKPLFEQQIDRLVINIQSSITASGGTALDVLERSPGVNVNQQSATISMNGKTGVMLMLNGKLIRMTIADAMQYLAGITSNSIEKIELITNPPAKYDADGNAGLINIVLKKNESFGTNGSFSVAGGQGFMPKFNSSLNLNHRRKRVNFYADLSAIKDYGKWRFNLDKESNYEDVTTRTNTDMVRINNRDIYTGRLGADFLVSDKTSIGVQLSGFINDFDILNENSVNIVRENNVPVRQVDVIRDESNVWKNALGNVSLRHQLSKRADLVIDADWVHYGDKQGGGYDNSFQFFNTTPSSSFEKMLTDKKTTIRMLVSKADLSYKLSAKTNMEIGLKGTFSDIRNNVELVRIIDGTRTVDPEFTNDFTLTDDIGAGYINFSGQLGVKLKWQAGFRGEYTHTHLSTPEDPEYIRRKYWGLFPSLFFSRQAGKNHRYQMSYSRRITRPEYTQIAPYIAFFGYDNFGSGNPALKAAFSDNAQLSYILKDAYIFSFDYSYQKDAIVSFQTRVDEKTKRFYATPNNIDAIHTYSIMASFPLKINSWWQTQSNVQYLFQQTKTDYLGTNFNVSYGYLQFSGQQTFAIANGYAAELSYNYTGGKWMGVGYNSAYGSLNVGLQKKLPRNLGTLRLSGTDLFWTSWAKYAYHNPELDLNTSWALRTDTRTIRLSYTRNFGNNKVKAAKRTTGSEEERKRVTF
jgi:hypothetical protein